MSCQAPGNELAYTCSRAEAAGGQIDKDCGKYGKWKREIINQVYLVCRERVRPSPLPHGARRSKVLTSTHAAAVTSVNNVNERQLTAATGQTGQRAVNRCWGELIYVID